MLGNIIAAVKKVVVGWVRSIGETVKRLVDPARIAGVQPAMPCALAQN